MIRNIFERYKAGTPARTVSNVADANWMRNFFNDLQGVGCRVEMPIHNGGLGCRIIVDGTTDVPYPDSSMNPFGADEDEYSFKCTYNDTDAVDVAAGTVYFLNQQIDYAGATGIGATFPGFVYLEVTLDANNQVSVYDVVTGATRPDFFDGTKYNFVIAELIAPDTVIQTAMGDIHSQAAPDFDNTDHRKVLRVNHLGFPYWGHQETFVAEISGTSTFTATEQIQNGASFSTGPRTGLTVYERNGLHNIIGGTFYAEVTETLDASGVAHYSFNMPVHHVGTAKQLLRTDENADGFEWGCAEIT